MDTSNTVTISNRSVKSYLNFGTLQFITVIANFYDGLSCYYGLTQQTKHARFRLSRPLPALHEFFAQGWKRPQWEQPWPQRHRIGLVLIQMRGAPGSPLEP